MPQPIPILYIMSITLTANYKEILATATVELIDELVDDSYALDDMLEFIDAHSEEMFVDNYVAYCEAGEAIGYEAVDAYIGDVGMCDLEDLAERYQGFYHNEAEFAEEFVEQMGYDIPSIVVVDWEQTWESSLRYDFTACRDGSSYRPCHIFRDM
jgi:antirestriction protein